MKILIAHDIDTSGRGNPYAFQLLKALETHPEVDAVQHGTAWKDTRDVEWDVVHIQWPESLTHWNSPTSTELHKIEAALQHWQRESVIVTTVHNEHPHGKDTDEYRDLYRLIYNYSDGLIHFGDKSKEVVRRRYEEEIANTVEAVIPHGDYSWFKDDVSREESRKRLGFDNEASLLLSFGWHRSLEEVDLVCEGFKQSSIPEKKLLIAGRLPHRKSRLNVNYYRTRLPIWTNPNIRSKEGFIPPDQVQLYLRSCDALVVPRYNPLNSGNVALAFTYGRVVAGPNAGVVGEVLRKTGNPTFDPEDKNSVARAFERAVSLSSTKGQENKKYADKNWAWNNIASKHIKLYNFLLKEKYKR